MTIGVGQTQRQGFEYVLNGLDDGVGFVSIEDPENPVYLGKLPTATDPSPWRDVKVYNNSRFYRE
jgi:hypothetical protein